MLSPLGQRIEKVGDYFKLDYGTLVVKWDTEGAVFITLHENIQKHEEIRGLCGNYNKDPLGE